MPVLGVPAFGHRIRGPAHVQDVPQLQLRVLFAPVSAGALAGTPEDMPGPAHGHAVPVSRGRGERRPPVRGTAVDYRTAWLLNARPRRRTMLLFGRRAGQQVRARSWWCAVRTNVRKVDRRRTRAGHGAAAVQGIRSGQAVRAPCVGVRAERGARSWASAVGTARGV